MPQTFLQQSFDGFAIQFCIAGSVEPLIKESSCQDILDEQIRKLGLCNYLINDVDERIALPDNVYADWIEGENSDTIIADWNQKVGSIFVSNKLRGCFFITVGMNAVWQSGGFW